VLRIDDRYLLDLAARLVNVESVAPREQALVDLLELELAGLGLKPRRLTVEPRRDNLLASLGDGEPVLCFNAHADTVPPAGDSVAEASLAGNRLYGLGSCDDKGPMAAMIAAVRAVVESGRPFHGRLDLLISLEEEAEGRGVASALRAGYRCDYAVVAEPTGLDVVNCHAGAVFLEITATGRAFHGSQPERGDNAIEKLWAFVQALRARALDQAAHPVIGAPSFNLGALHGGDRANRVPNRAVAQVDLRVIPPVGGAELLRRAQDLAAQPRWSGIRLRVAKYADPLDTPADSPLVRTIRRVASEVRGEPCETVGWRAWTEAAPFRTALGADAVVFGPGNLEQAHSTDEYIEIGQLLLGAQAYAAIASNLLGRDKDG